MRSPFVSTDGAPGLRIGVPHHETLLSVSCNILSCQLRAFVEQNNKHSRVVFAVRMGVNMLYHYNIWADEK